MKAKGSRGLKWLGKGAIWILYLLGVSALASGTEQLWVPAGFEIQVYSDSVPDGVGPVNPVGFFFLIAIATRRILTLNLI